MAKTKTTPKEGTKPAKQRIVNNTPVYSAVYDVTPEEIQEALHKVTHRSEFTRVIDTLNIGQGKKFESGDIARIRLKVASFSKRRGKAFTVTSGSDGFVIVIRVDDKSSQVADNESSQTVGDEPIL